VTELVRGREALSFPAIPQTPAAAWGAPPPESAGCSQPTRLSGQERPPSESARVNLLPSEGCDVFVVAGDSARPIVDDQPKLAYLPGAQLFDGLLQLCHKLRLIGIGRLDLDDLGRTNGGVLQLQQFGSR